MKITSSAQKLDFEKIQSALDKVVDVITSTMGPGGRNVLIQAPYDVIYHETADLTKDASIKSTLVSKDGVTVSRFLRYFEDELEQALAKIVSDAASNVVKEVGDGTTTVSYLIGALFREAVYYISSEKNPINVYHVVQGMMTACDSVCDKVRKMSRSIVTKGGFHKERLRAIATISANNDAKLGELVATAVAAAGRSGTVRVAESRTGLDYMMAESGYAMPMGYWSDDYVRMGDVVLNDPAVLLIDKKLENFDMIAPLLDNWMSTWALRDKAGNLIRGANGSLRINKPLVLVISDIEGSAKASLLLNWREHGQPIYMLRVPYTGKARADMLLDLKEVLGVHQIFSDTEGHTISRFGRDFQFKNDKGEVMNYGYLEYGVADKITLSKDKMVVQMRDKECFEQGFSVPTGLGLGVGVAKYTDLYKNRLDKLTKRLSELVEQEEDATTKGWMEERLARLTGGLVTMYVQAGSIAELNNKKELVDDAIRACMTAVKGGVVAGGGRALQYIGDELRKKAKFDIKDGNARWLGYMAFLQCMDGPMRKLRANCGWVEAFSEFREQVEKLENRTSAFGINPITGQIEDFFVKGILDPADTLVAVLETATSVVGQLLTMDYFINVQKV